MQIEPNEPTTFQLSTDGLGHVTIPKRVSATVYEIVADTTPARALSDFLAESFVAQGLNLSAAAKELDVQIIFEGTVRIVHPGSESCALTDFRFGSKITKRNPVRTFA